MAPNDARKKKHASLLSAGFGRFMSSFGPRFGIWIAGNLYLSHCPSRDEVIQTVVKDRLFTMTRFKSLMKFTKNDAWFEELDESEIDMDYHVRYAFDNNDQIINESQLLEFVGNLTETGLRSDMPLWRIYIVQNFLLPSSEDGKVGAACVFVLNHALSDGIASIGVMLKLLDDSPVDPNKPMTPVGNPSKDAQALEKDEKEFVVQKRAKPPKLTGFERFRAFFGGCWTGMTFAFDAPDPPNAVRLDTSDKQFISKYAATKRLAKSSPIDLNEIKALKNKLGGTVNDVLLALMTITIKKYLEDVKEPLLGKKFLLRGQFPVNMRKNDAPLLKNGNPNNDWEAVSFEYPLNYASAIDCFFKVQHQVNRMKVSPQLYIQRFAENLGSGVLSSDAFVDLIWKSVTKASTMISNVPGPQHKVHICGATIEELSFFLFAPVGLYMGVISYANMVSLTINSDMGLDIDPNQLVTHWTEAYDMLKAEVANFKEHIPTTESARKKLLKNNATAVVPTAEV